MHTIFFVFIQPFLWFFMDIRLAVLCRAFLFCYDDIRIIGFSLSIFMILCINADWLELVVGGYTLTLIRINIFIAVFRSSLKMFTCIPFVTFYSITNGIDVVVLLHDVTTRLPSQLHHKQHGNRFRKTRNIGSANCQLDSCLFPLLSIFFSFLLLSFVVLRSLFCFVSFSLFSFFFYFIL